MFILFLVINKTELASTPYCTQFVKDAEYRFSSTGLWEKIKPVAEATVPVLVDALCVSEDEVTLEARVMQDLGAESIDVLDIAFKYEQRTSLSLRGSNPLDDPLLPEGVMLYDENQLLSSTAMTYLEKQGPNQPFWYTLSSQDKDDLLRSPDLRTYNGMKTVAGLMLKVAISLEEPLRTNSGEW